MEQDFLAKVQILHDEGLGSRKIAQKLLTTRYQVQKAYQEINFDSKVKTVSKIVKQKKCKICEQEKNISSFRKRIRNNHVSYESYCQSCEKLYNKIKCKERYLKNKKWWIEYRDKNKDKINKGYRDRYSQVEVKLRRRCSSSIRSALKTSKKISCLDILPFSISELKNHLEVQFEPWMTWDNWGVYSLDSWDDNNCKTWTWQIDHIIPQSKLPYDCISHPNFLKCWSLENLRPLRSKDNLIKSNKSII